MDTFQHLCPSCDRLLELPGDAIGRLAKCPACHAIFTIDRPSHGATAVEPAAPEHRPLERASSEQASPDPSPHQHPSSEQSSAESLPAHGTPADPMTPPANPFSSPLQSGLSAEFPIRHETGVSYDRDPIAKIDSFPIVPRSIEEILSATLSIFGARWWYLVVGCPLLVIVPIVAFNLYVNVINSLSQAGARGLAGLGMLIGIPLGIVMLGYACVAIARLVIAVARDSPTPIKDLIPTPGIVAQFLVGLALLAIVVAIGFLLGAAAVALASRLGNQALTGLTAGLATIVSITVLMAAVWLLWSWLLIVSDGRGRAIRSLRVACELSLHTKLTSALMLLVTIALSVFGLMVCYVGLFLTEPFLMLMFGVAYLLITNQRIGDPRNVAAEPTEHYR